VSLQGREAVRTVEGATEGDVCRVYVEQVVWPTLHPADIVALDTLGAHKVSGIQEAIQAPGARVMDWPPYSPARSPLEPCWSKVKAALRGIGARTRRALERALQHVLLTITESDALAWFAHCGYVVN
jgi:transposase